jgi:hypothetical protein
MLGDVCIDVEDDERLVCCDVEADDLEPSIATVVYLEVTAEVLVVGLVYDRTVRVGANVVNGLTKVVNECPGYCAQSCVCSQGR